MIAYKSMKEADYENLGGVATISNIDSVYRINGISNLQFDIASESERKYIQLVRDCVNIVRTRDNGKLLAKILGIKASTVKGLIDFTMVGYLNDSTMGADIIDFHSSLERARIVWGPQLLKSYIDEFDIESAIIDAFEEIIYNNFAMKYISTDYGSITKSKTDASIPLYGGYHLIPSADFNLKLKRGMNLEKFIDYIEHYVKTGEERISYLLNMSNKDNIYGMLINKITVIPESMRPKIENRQAPITTMYKDVIKASSDLMMQLSNSESTSTEICARYSKLQRTVTELLYQGNSSTPNRRSIVEILKGKKGHLRSLQGKRVDLSGRSVIISDPTLKIDECALPADMIAKLYRYHHLRYSGKKIKEILSNSNETNAKEIEKLGILRDIPCMLNRAPTLHSLGIQGFWVKLSTNKAIHLHALACEAFNADFDGDQMGVHVPIGQKAIQEAIILLSPLNNMLKPTTGQPIMKPRHEMLYGLYVATKEWPEEEYKTYNVGSAEELGISMEQGIIKPWDKVTLSGFKTDNAGRVIVRTFVPEKIRDSINVIGKKEITQIVIELIGCGGNQFKESVHHFTQFGFKMATIYAPTLTLLQDIDKTKINEHFKNLHDKMEEATYLHEKGLMSDREYLALFNDMESKLSKDVVHSIKNGVIPETDGFRLLVESGARGGDNNLLQIFGYKGKAMKNSFESFPVIIENSFVDGLTPFEHFMASFGARTDSMAKSNSTADTGYDSRLMDHSSLDIVIRSKDCGTKNGITIRKVDLRRYVQSVSEELKEEMVVQYVEEFIKGRYLAEDSTYITASMASKLAKEKEVIKIRSVLTCPDQCCAKCYGDDIGHGGQAIVGHPVGVIAAQALGELVTQLNMNQFHGGGVAGGASVASQFAKVDSLIKQVRIRGKEEFQAYEPIAWSSGKVKVTAFTPTLNKISIEGDLHTINVNSKRAIKEYVKVGEPIGLDFGDYDTQEILRYSGLEQAWIHMLYSMFIAYREKEEINFKHFECVVAGMTKYVILDAGDREDLRPCKFYDLDELHKGDIASVRYRPVIIGVKNIQTRSHNLLANLELEDIVNGLSRGLLQENTDELRGATASTMIGRKPRLGTYYENYISDRLR